MILDGRATMHIACYILGVFCYVSFLHASHAKGTSKSTSKNVNKSQNSRLAEPEQLLDLRKISVDMSTELKRKLSEEMTSPIYDAEFSSGGEMKYYSERDGSDVIVVGIAGGSGSGKTTLARAIYEAMGIDNVTYISHDHYYKDISHLPIHVREKQNFDHPNALDTDLLIDHLKKLKQGEDVMIPQYDFATHSRKSITELTLPRPIILIEGILIFTNKDLLEQMDIRVFVDTEDDIRLIRRIQRDVVERARTLDSIITQYLTTVRPMHLEFVEASKRNAHIIVPVGLNAVALELVVHRLKSAIRKYHRNRSVPPSRGSTKSELSAIPNTVEIN